MPLGLCQRIFRQRMRNLPRHLTETSFRKTDDAKPEVTFMTKGTAVVSKGRVEMLVDPPVMPTAIISRVATAALPSTGCCNFFDTVSFETGS
jgi:hypothetical protein